MVAASKIRTLIIEDNRILREGIARMIAADDIRVTGLSNGSDHPLAKARQAKAQVVLVDISLHQRDALDIVKSLHQELPEARIIGMGLAASQLDIMEFVEAGVAGFVLKDATIKEFLSTIRSVFKGAKVLPPLLTESLFAQIVEYASMRGKKSLSGAVRLTNREKEIIMLVAEGLSNKEIAEQLNVATFTVKSHVHNVLEKLQLRSRLQIAKYLHDETTP